MNSRLNKMNSRQNKENHNGKTDSEIHWEPVEVIFKQFFCVRIVRVCDLGSGASCLISLQCSFEPSWFGCMITTLHVLSYTLLNTLENLMQRSERISFVSNRQICVRKSLSSLTRAQATRNIKTGVNTRLRI